MRSAVLFDLDGTLVDTPRAIVETFTAVFAELGRPLPAAGAIRATIGLPLDHAFASLTGEPAADTAPYVRAYLRLFGEIVLPRAASLLFPGVVAGLAELRGYGYALAVATSKYHASADALLAAAGIRDEFAVVVAADQVTRPKPDPETGRLVLATLGIPAERAVMVGDTTHDVLMATAAGLRSVAVSYGVHTVAQLRSADPTWLADSFGAVVAALRAGLPVSPLPEPESELTS
jgi:phosphoglycolate phosphatase